MVGKPPRKRAIGAGAKGSSRGRGGGDRASVKPRAAAKRRASDARKRPQAKSKVVGRKKSSSVQTTRPVKTMGKARTRSRKTAANLVERRGAQRRPSVGPPVNGQSLRQRMYRRSRVPKNYLPTEHETFMNSRQLGFFKNKLLSWREELLRESSQTIMNLQEGGLSEPDLADRASAESDRALELRSRDRERKLISKIDAALERIESGT